MDKRKWVDPAPSRIMKYFTREWCWSELSDKVINNISKDYERYINSIYIALPFTLKMIAKKINLHDGIISTISISFSEENLVLSGIFGDLEVGYFKLEICYESIFDFDLDHTILFFSEKEIEILRDELEVVSNFNSEFFVHKFIFSNKSEFKICFRDCYLTIENATSKDYKKTPCTINFS
jgi:hypothetical protein